ncbi:hypothetical protein [Streptomyces sp. NPDC051776]|uniref:hypothetical protein n=1 Tax=Streptomyces sp. NPDC051776 TaxID=3155414 RepID=UPI00342E34BF
MLLYLLTGMGAGAGLLTVLLTRRRRRPTENVDGLFIERAAAERTRLLRETCGTGAPEPLG